MRTAVFMESVLQSLVAEGTLAMTKPEQPAYVHQEYVAVKQLSEQQIKE